ncbi:MAG: hypothetical protein ABSG68_10445 [Thermoguttaceae bacterium]
MMRHVGLLLLGILLAPSPAGPCLRAAEREGPEFVGIRVGFGDRYKVGLWTPVEVTLRGGTRPMTGEVCLTVPDGDGVPTRVSTPPERPCQVLPGVDSRVTLYVRVGNTEPTIEAAFLVEGRPVARRKFETALNADEEHFIEALDGRQLLLCVGAASAGVEDATNLSGLPRDQRPVVVRVNDAGGLPTHWYGYEGVDAVVLLTSRPDVYRSLTPENPRVAALDQWVRMGGKLLLSAGAQADEMLDPKAALARFVPGRFDRVVSLRQTAALETFAGSSQALAQSAPLRCARLTGVQGTVEAREADLPLVVRTAHGFGQIVFVATDLEQPPVSRWSDRAVFVAKLLDLPTARVEQSENGNVAMQEGYRDLAGQLRSALDRFIGVRLVPFWLVDLMVIGYIVLIGPADYFFLRKVVHRMEWTWCTFPAIVLAVSLGAYLLAYHLKGRQLRLNQVDLIDVDADSKLVRGTSWMNVFSPRMQAADFALQPLLPDGAAPPQAATMISWLGLPGTGLGGMSPRAASPGLWSGQYAFTPDLDLMARVPIQVWSTKSFTGRWSAAAPSGYVDAALADEDRVPVGSITNKLSFPLRRCLLAYDHWAYELGTLAPGQSTRLSSTTRRTELRTLLTGRKFIFDDKDKLNKFHQEATPFDRSSTDVAYILRAMMFFQAAGGRRYTRLANDYQGFVDFSGLLKTHRAVLIAYPEPQPDTRLGAELLRDGAAIRGPDDQHTTVYRFVLPVTQPAAEQKP